MIQTAADLVGLGTAPLGALVACFIGLVVGLFGAFRWCIRGTWLAVAMMAAGVALEAVSIFMAVWR